MTGGLPIGFDLCNSTYIGSTSSGLDYIAPAAPATANTKSAWTQLTASVGLDVCWMELEFEITGSATVGVSIAIDIAIGPSGSEQVIVSNLILSAQINFGGWGHICFPISIPAGTRIAMRYQSTAANSSFANPITYFSCKVYDGGLTQMEGVAGIDAIGATALTASPYSTTLTAGHQAMGSYTQLVASTARDYLGFLIVPDNQTVGDQTNFPVGQIDIAIGPSGSERVISTLMFDQNTLIAGAVRMVAVPAGTRIAARSGVNSASFTGHVGCVVYGLYQ